MNPSKYRVEIKFSIQEINKNDWKELSRGIDNPFYNWNWLYNLEISKSVSRKTGWQPLYFIAYKGTEINGIAPLYLKNHSYGEFIFDQTFAKLAYDLNLNYYPKLIGMSPYSPIKGYQFFYKENSDKNEITKLLVNHIDNFAFKNNIISCSFLYIDENWGNYLKSLGYYEWINTSSEWENIGENSFDDFLSRFNSNQRRNIKKERKSIAKENIRINIHTKENINKELIHEMHDFYQNHCLRWGVWGSKYLTYEFFEKIIKDKENLLIFSASKDETDNKIAMSMCIKNDKKLWGRYWGSKTEINNLHFELCYYQPIEWAIENKIKSFDPGAGGNHKRRRGFLAKDSKSLLKWFNKNMEDILAPWLKQANQQVIKTNIIENKSIPFN